MLKLGRGCKLEFGMMRFMRSNRRKSMIRKLVLRNNVNKCNKFSKVSYRTKNSLQNYSKHPNLEQTLKHPHIINTTP